MSEPPGGRFETFDANEWFVVVRDDDGYAVWRMDDLEDGEPIERFVDDDDGYERAVGRWKELTKAERRHHGLWLGRLRILILVTLATWVVSSAIPLVIALFGGDDIFPGGAREGGFERTMYLLSALTFDVWIASTIAYVILWLEGRRAR